MKPFGSSHMFDMTPPPEPPGKPAGHRLLDTMEAGRVLRYHAAPSVQPQTVGLHSWGVMILALYITNGNASRELLIECAMHDSAEYFTGDVPFNVKRDNADVKKRFDAMEDTARNNELLLAPIDLDEHDKAVLKLADTLDGLIWCAKTEVLGPIRDRWKASMRNGLDKFERVLSVEERSRASHIAQLF